MNEPEKLLHKLSTETISLLRDLVDRPLLDPRSPNEALAALLGLGLAEIVTGKDKTLARATWAGRLMNIEWRRLAGGR